MDLTSILREFLHGYCDLIPEIPPQMRDDLLLEFQVQYMDKKPKVFGQQLGLAITVTVWPLVSLSHIIEVMLHEFTHLVIREVLQTEEEDFHGQLFWDVFTALSREAYPIVGDITLSDYHQLTYALQKAGIP